MRETAWKRPSFAAIVVISVLFLVYVWDRVIVPIQAVEIRSALTLSLPSIGLLGSVFTLGLMLASLPAGVFADRQGARASLVLGAALFSIATLWFGLTASFGLMLGLRVASGIGEGFYNVALLTFLGRLTRKYRSLAVGFPATLFGLGVFTGPPVVLALHHWSGGWRPPFLILGAVGIAGALAVRALLDEARPAAGEAAPRISLARVGAVLNPGTIAIYLTIAATGLIVYSYLSLMAPYLHANGHLSRLAIGTVFSLFGIGQALGGVGMGIVGDLVGRGRFIAVVTVLTAVVGAAMFWVTPGLAVSGALNFAMGLGTNGIYCNCIALAQDRAGNENIPLATGLIAVVYYLMSSISGFVVGHMVSSLGWGLAGALAYALPYLVIAPFLFALIWRVPPEPATIPSPVAGSSVR